MRNADGVLKLRCAKVRRWDKDASLDTNTSPLLRLTHKRKNLYKSKNTKQRKNAKIVFGLGDIISRAKCIKHELKTSSQI